MSFLQFMTVTYFAMTFDRLMFIAFPSRNPSWANVVTAAICWAVLYAVLRYRGERVFKD